MRPRPGAARPCWGDVRCRLERSGERSADSGEILRSLRMAGCAPPMTVGWIRTTSRQMRPSSLGDTSSRRCAAFVEMFVDLHGRFLHHGVGLLTSTEQQRSSCRGSAECVRRRCQKPIPAGRPICGRGWQLSRLSLDEVHAFRLGKEMSQHVFGGGAAAVRHRLRRPQRRATRLWPLRLSVLSFSFLRCVPGWPAWLSCRRWPCPQTCRALRTAVSRDGEAGFCSCFLIGQPTADVQFSFGGNGRGDRACRGFLNVMDLGLFLPFQGVRSIQLPTRTRRP